MLKWIIRITFAFAGTILLVMVRASGGHPLFYIFPILLILIAFLDCIEYTPQECSIIDDVDEVVIRADNRRWDFSEKECCRNYENKESKRIHKIVL